MESVVLEKAPKDCSVSSKKQPWDDAAGDDLHEIPFYAHL
jgi:hypothetical protein